VIHARFSDHQADPVEVVKKLFNGVKSDFEESTMSKGYWVIHVDVTEQEQFKKYAVANSGAFKKYGARFLARAGQYTVAEGMTRTRNTIVEFPSYQSAVDCWNSPEYQAALTLRLSAATMDLIIVEGYDGPQPS